MDDDIERQTTHKIPEDIKAKKVRAFWVTVLISVTFAACVMVPVIYYSDDAHYSVAIDSASALDLRSGVSFNLTLGVASRSHGAKACIEPGMFVQVAYRGVQVAASNGAETRQTCAKPRKTAELSIMARATMNPVGTMLDSLAAEMRQQAALFDLRLIVPYWRRTTMAYKVFDCERSRVGDAAMPCASPTYSS